MGHGINKKFGNAYCYRMFLFETSKKNKTYLILQSNILKSSNHSEMSVPIYCAYERIFPSGTPLSANDERIDKKPRVRPYPRVYNKNCLVNVEAEEQHEKPVLIAMNDRFVTSGCARTSYYSNQPSVRVAVATI